MIYLYLFLEFFKIGLFTFGGGYAMIPLIKETVLHYGWMSEEMFYDFIGVCEATPGAIAVNMATYIGNTQGGILGSVIATFGVILPSFLIIILVATILKKLIHNVYFNAIMKGIKPIVIALILSTGTILLCKQLGFSDGLSFNCSLSSFLIFFVLGIVYLIYYFIRKKALNPILLIFISAILGIVTNLFF